MSKRTEQIESVLLRSISKVLARQISDPRIEGMISVTKVDVSPDLHDAYVYVSIMPDRFERRTIYGLKHAAGYIQSLVRKDVAMRAVPHLDFRLDSSLKKSAEIFDAIRRGLDTDTPDSAPETAEPAADTTVDEGSADGEDLK
jgi:ribosome-binding factor A